MHKILANQSPKEVDGILFKKWGIRLFKFAQLFAVYPADILIGKDDNPPLSPAQLDEANGVLDRMLQEVASSILVSSTTEIT